MVLKEQHLNWIKYSIRWIWRRANSKVGLLVVAFLLTSYLGQKLTFQYQQEFWEREKQHAIFKSELAEAQKVLEQVTQHISQRTHAMQKVHWELEDSDFRNAELKYSNYLKIKDDWVINLSIYRNKIKRLVDSDLAYKLLDSKNAKNAASTESVQAKFRHTHYATKAWKECVENKCKNFELLKTRASESLTSLFEYTDDFIDETYSVFLSKHKKLNSEI